MDYLNETAALQHRVWPLLPEVPRYRYSGQLLGEPNLVNADDDRPGIFSNFLRWLLGIDSSTRPVALLQRPQSGMVYDGNIYVTDIGRHAVFVFDEKSPKLHIWENADQERRFIAPVGIARSNDGHILVADAELGCIVRLDLSGNPVDSFGSGILKRPTGLAFDRSTGRLYVSDTSSHDVKVFDEKGMHVKTIGTRGTLPGQFNGPTHIAFNNNMLIVSDTLNARVQELSPDGEPIKVTGKRGLFVGNLIRPKGVAMDDDGNVYVIEGYYDHLLIYNSNNELLLPIGGTGTEVGKFFLPAGVWIDSNNRVFVADMFNSRVIIFQYLGQ